MGRLTTHHSPTHHSPTHLPAQKNPPAKPSAHIPAPGSRSTLRRRCLVLAALGCEKAKDKLESRRKARGLIVMAVTSYGNLRLVMLGKARQLHSM